MTSPSDDQPNHKPQNPVSQVTQASKNGQDAKVDTEKENSPTSVFVNSEPIREEQVQNAVRFLSHAKVKGSPVIYRRSFLERKGLTKEEIDEAFRRVPDSAPTVSTTESVANQDGQIRSSLNSQQQPPAQGLQSMLAGPASAGSTSNVVTLSRFRWYHGVLAASVLTVSQVLAAVLFKRLVVPKLKSWIRWVILEADEKVPVKRNDAKPSVAEEAAAAAKAAAVAAADVAQTSQDMLMRKGEEKRCLEELVSILRVQANEMKSLSSAIKKLEGGHQINGSGIAVVDQDYKKIPRTSVKQPYANGQDGFDSHSVKIFSSPAPAEPSVAPHPKSYMEIMAMIQRGEKPSNIRDINDAPPNPNQPLPNPRIAPKRKPWEVSEALKRSVSAFPSQANSNGAMYESSMDQLNRDNMVPWQQKSARATRIDTGDELKFVSPNALSNELPVEKSWVPPQRLPDPVPEEAAAIQKLKKASSPTEQLTDDSQSAEAIDELQKITKISEFGGPLEVNDQNFAVGSNEIMPEESASYLEA